MGRLLFMDATHIPVKRQTVSKEAVYITIGILISCINYFLFTFNKKKVFTSMDNNKGSVAKF
ncbi:hypothetical protein EfmJHP36_32380 (plasmid) [Enterococcus faecium]|nr:hypothetical protein EfmJHP36_32380 [Enterococcus faecium]